MCFIGGYMGYRYMLLIGSIDTTPVCLSMAGNDSKLGTLQHTASCPSFRVVPSDFREYVSRKEGETETDSIAVNFKGYGTHNLSTIRGKQKRETLITANSRIKHYTDINLDYHAEGIERTSNKNLKRGTRDESLLSTRNIIGAMPINTISSLDLGQGFNSHSKRQSSKIRQSLAIFHLF